VCKRKIQLSFHSFSESLDTAEVLFSLKVCFFYNCSMCFVLVLRFLNFFRFFFFCFIFSINWSLS
jgi:hypothetical protein